MGDVEAIGGAKPSRKSGNAEYNAYLKSERWQKLRRAVKLRAHGVCEICRRRRGKEAAHLTYDRIFREPLEDVLWVCGKCHRDLDEPAVDEE